MREYVYNEIAPYAGLDTVGRKFELNKGSIITTMDGEMFTFMEHKFAIDSSRLEKWFLKVYTLEEIQHYKDLRDRAAIAFLQGYATEGADGWRAVYEMNVLSEDDKLRVKRAIMVAEELVRQIKEKDV